MGLGHMNLETPVAINDVAIKGMIMSWLLVISITMTKAVMGV